MSFTANQVALVFVLSAMSATVCVFINCGSNNEEMVRFVLRPSTSPKKSTLSHDGCSDRDMFSIWLFSMCVLVVWATIVEILFGRRQREYARAPERQPIPVPQPVQQPQTFPEDEKASIPSEECLICKENKRIYTALACGHLIACASCKHRIETSRCPLCNKANTGWLRTFY